MEVGSWREKQRDRRRRRHTGRHGEIGSRDRKTTEERQGTRQTQRDREGSITKGERQTVRQTEREGHREERSKGA